MSHILETYQGRAAGLCGGLLLEFHLKGEDVKRSIEWLIRRIIKAISLISYHGRRWWVHFASSFHLAHHYREVLGTG